MLGSPGEFAAPEDAGRSGRTGSVVPARTLAIDRVVVVILWPKAGELVERVADVEWVLVVGSGSGVKRHVEVQ